MKSDPHFKQPNAIRNQRPKDMPIDEVKSPWDYRCPQYDQRSSSWVNAGTCYGIAMKQPVGHEGNPKTRVSILPFGRVPTMDCDETA